MKKFLAFAIIFFSTISSISAEEIKRIFVGNKDAKITIIAFESLTCSHCANFHKDVYPQLKKEYLDTGLAKIEFRHFPLDVAAFNASKVSQCKNDGDSNILNSLFANQQKCCCWDGVCSGLISLRLLIARRLITTLIHKQKSTPSAPATQC